MGFMGEALQDFLGWLYPDIPPIFAWAATVYCIVTDYLLRCSPGLDPVRRAIGYRVGDYVWVRSHKNYRVFLGRWPVSWREAIVDRVDGAVTVRLTYPVDGICYTPLLQIPGEEQFTLYPRDYGCLLRLLFWRVPLVCAIWYVPFCGLNNIHVLWMWSKWRLVGGFGLDGLCATWIIMSPFLWVYPDELSVVIRFYSELLVGGLSTGLGLLFMIQVCLLIPWNAEAGRPMTLAEGIAWVQTRPPSGTVAT
jgi:hypothetical protein